MEFSFYHGIKDTLSWLNLCDQYFKIHEKEETTMFHMRQKAQLWPNKLKQKEPGWVVLGCIQDLLSLALQTLPFKAALGS